jgi:hypothetical protein
MKCYLMTWTVSLEGGGQIDRQEILNYFETDQRIRNWRASTGAIFIVSEASQLELGDRLHLRFPNLHYIITPLNMTELWGWTDKETWEFILRPRRAGEP